jgi:hypothetical protein
MIIKQYPNVSTALNDAATRPECDLKISKKCNNKAIQVLMGNDGTPVKVCGWCAWLAIRGVEWNPKPSTDVKVAGIPANGNEKVAQLVSKDGN